jgi:hypothetical protein
LRDPNASFRGLLVSLASLLAFVALIMFLTRAYRLRLTRAGDFVLYRGNPRRPLWIGRTDQLQCEIVMTMKGDRMAVLRFDGKMKHWYPVAPFAASALRDAFR